MASWALRCPNRRSTFRHTPLEDTFENFFWRLNQCFPPIASQSMVRGVGALTGISKLI